MKASILLKAIPIAALIGFGIYDRVDSAETAPEASQLIEVGQEVPDLEGRTPSGEIIRLSDLRGQVVLIDFWASWCGPCVYNMPAVVDTYNQFRDSKFESGEEGFTVFSVSLDQNKTAWKNGIERLNQTWPHHISDLRGWGSSHATKYNVNSIPQTFLIDGEGKLINRNLHAQALNAVLADMQD